MSQNPLDMGIQKIIENKSVFLVIVVVLIAVICGVILFGDYSTKVVNYKEQNKSKLEKIDLISAANKSTEALDGFAKNFPNSFSGDELANKVEEYAIRHHINIVDMTSKDPQKLDMYATISIKTSFVVKDFKDLVAFFDEIENSPYSLKVESLSAGTRDATDGSFSCEVNIVATQIKR